MGFTLVSVSMMVLMAVILVYKDKYARADESSERNYFE
jgi:hypothetical protein